VASVAAAGPAVVWHVRNSIGAVSTALMSVQSKLASHGATVARQTTTAEQHKACGKCGRAWLLTPSCHPRIATHARQTRLRSRQTRRTHNRAAWSNARRARTVDNVHSGLVVVAGVSLRLQCRRVAVLQCRPCGPPHLRMASFWSCPLIAVPLTIIWATSSCDGRPPKPWRKARGW
jgi:hypothetical protein